MDNDTYVLHRSYRQAARLNLYSHLWRDFIGYNLHPIITDSQKGSDHSALPEKQQESTPDSTSLLTPPPLRVADIGCGTGAWLVELSQSLGPSEARLDGFDISDEQFPHPGALPSHVRLRTADATAEAPPEDCRGVYDVVHIRLMIAVVDGGDPARLLGFCRQLLKPSGLLQWDELDPANFERVWCSPNEAFPTPCIDQLWYIWQHTKPTGYVPISVYATGQTCLKVASITSHLPWITDLPTHFEKAGFSIRTVQRHTEHPWQRNMMMGIWPLVADEFAADLRQQAALRAAPSKEGPTTMDSASNSLSKEQGTTKPSPPNAETIAMVAAGAFGEIRRGAHIRHSVQMVVGQLV